jgi:hypothetical protein
MKKEMYIIITALALILFLPLANAEINLNPLAKTTYNKGDVLKVNGYVRSDTNGNFPLTMYLSCDTAQIQVLTRNMNVIAEKDYPISSDVSIPFSNEISGSCTVQVNFGTEQVSTEPFSITKGLRGTFTLSPLSIQLGDEITVTGTVTKINGDNIDGIGTLYIEKDDKNYDTVNVQISNSKFTYNTQIKSITEGSYHINLAVKDQSGNEEFFWNAATLNVYEKLKITANLDKQQYGPEDTIKIKGSVEKTIGTTIATAQVKFTLDDNEYTADVKDNKFEYDLPISSSLKSFYHDLKIEVTDDYGNNGEKIVKLYIIPQEIKIESGIAKDFFAPKEIVTLNPKLYDQAADAISDNVLLTVTDSQNKKILEKEIPTNEEFNFKLNQFAAPGMWKISLKSKSLSTDNSFNVDTVEDISIDLQGQILKVKNIGNIQYKNSIQITATDSKNIPYSYSVKTNLAPNEDMTYELYKDLTPGKYQIFIEDKGLKFEDVNVVDKRNFVGKIGDFFSQATGAAIGTPGTSSNNKPLIYIASLLTLVILGVFFVSYRGRLRNNLLRDRERRQGQQHLQRMQSSPEAKPRSQKYGKANQDDIKDFQQRIVKDMQNNSIRKEQPEFDSETKTVRSSIERKLVYDRDRKY